MDQPGAQRCAAAFPRRPRAAQHGPAPQVRRQRPGRPRRDTFGLLEELVALGVDGGAGMDGFLFAYPSYEGAAHGLAGFRRLGAPVAPEGVLRSAAPAEAEPALGPAARAGFLVERQWAVDPGQFVGTLAERLRRDGAELVEGARVTAVREDADRIEARTTAGTYRADAVVIAAGVWSREVCASLGVRIEMAAGKGYSFSVPAESVPNAWSIWARRRRCWRRRARGCGSPGPWSSTGTWTGSDRAACRRWWRLACRICRAPTGSGGSRSGWGRAR
ncbi:FAD-dependent oxidoreductase [Streptomyces sp. MS1.AVA.1]|uniref:FAD-dependent oxidoreductase n=1 Tax=Streptomyces machairae TaxID=3134109 RepID=A0ABU8US89_9ACTN